MKKYLFLLTGALSLNFLAAQSPTYQWARQIGSSNTDKGFAITTDAAGNVYTAGYFQNVADFDPGPASFLMSAAGFEDIFIQKLDAAGNFIWAKQMGGASMDAALGISLDASGNVYTTGYFQGVADFDPGPGTYTLSSLSYEDIFVSKLSASGNFVWVKQIGSSASGATDEGDCITLDASGNVYIGGRYTKTTDFDPGPGTYTMACSGVYDSFIEKLDGAGNFVWVSTLNGIGDDHLYSLGLDAANNVYSTGSFDKTADFDPGAGSYTLTPAGGNDDIFLWKLNAGGNFVWAKQMGGSGYEEGLGIAVDAPGNVYATGYFPNDTVDMDPGPSTYTLTSSGFGDSFVSKLDSGGNFVWARQVSGSSIEKGYGIALDGAGNVYTTGYFDGNADFDPGPGVYTMTVMPGGDDAYIWKLDASGNYIWAGQLGGASGVAYGQGLTVDVAGNIYSTGFFQVTCDFNPGVPVANLTSVGAYDIYTHKMAQGATLIKENSFEGSIKLYPNPTNGIVNLIYNVPMQKMQVKLINSLGETVMEKTAYDSNVISFDATKERAGIYFIELQTDNGIVRSKFVKE